ncbi:MAG: hypothetical protein FJ318_08320 [SAR202 cluster bacterium]|nr:hypothetical protein [SAR202 cluster bacterium]
MSTHKALFADPNPNHHVFVNGHSLTFRVVDDDSPRRAHGITKFNYDALLQHHRRTLPEAERRLGHYRARHIHLANHSLVPNTVLGFRLALPRGPPATEFWHFGLVEKDMAKDLHHAFAQGSSQGNGAAGLNEQDDIDNWRQVTEASKSPVARRVRQIVSMGSGRTLRHDI